MGFHMSCLISKGLVSSGLLYVKSHEGGSFTVGLSTYEVDLVNTLPPATVTAMIIPLPSTSVEPG